MFPIRDHNPSNRIPYVTYALLAANIGVFLSYLGLFGDELALSRFFVTYGLVPAEVADGRNWGTVVTSMFLHAGWAHLAGNMLFLWIFGDNLEDQFGRLGFAVFYLLSGLGAALAQIAVDPASPVPMVGASGAIAGVMGGYLLLFPKARIDILLFIVILIRIFPIPAWVGLGLWFGFQVVSGIVDQGAGGGVAYWAHAGGFVVGFVLCSHCGWAVGGRGSGTEPMAIPHTPRRPIA